MAKTDPQKKAGAAKKRGAVAVRKRGAVAIRKRGMAPPVRKRRRRGRARVRNLKAPTLEPSWRSVECVPRK